jgi:hypothetical protein
VVLTLHSGGKDREIYLPNKQQHRATTVILCVVGLKNVMQLLGGPHFNPRELQCFSFWENCRVIISNTAMINVLPTTKSKCNDDTENPECN